uniref:LRR-RLK n=1 Tax=Rhizophora mucronata TaxID=61149 RepID=A0A2P2K0K5_RHIMU
MEFGIRPCNLVFEAAKTTKLEKFASPTKVVAISPENLLLDRSK